MQLQPLCTGEVAVKSLGSLAEAHPIRCKRWSCEVCAQINRRRVIAIAVAARPRAFLTLTVSSAHHPTPDAAAAALKRGLRLLRLRLSRHEKLDNFEFLAVFERHKSGYPHLHLMIRGKFIPWVKLRQWWEEITGSTHVDIRKIDTRGKAAFYVAKYLGKDLSPFEACKRWWRSHGYSEDAEDDYALDRSWPKPTRHLVDFARIEFALRQLEFPFERVGREGIRWRKPEDIKLAHDAVLYIANGFRRATARDWSGAGR